MGTGITRYYPKVDITGLTVKEAYRKLLSAYLMTDIERHNKLSDAGVPETDDEFLAMLMGSVVCADCIAQGGILK